MPTMTAEGSMGDKSRSSSKRLLCGLALCSELVKGPKKPCVCGRLRRQAMTTMGRGGDLFTVCLVAQEHIAKVRSALASLAGLSLSIVAKWANEC